MLLSFSRWLTADVLGVDPLSHFGMTLEFFFYDALKISFLLLVIIFLISLVRTFIPAQRIKRWMTLPGGLGHVAAAFFGAVTPFCSCSSMPIFFGMIKAGVPLGVVFSFLITSPLVNEYVVVLMVGLFGWKIAMLYALSGIVLGIVAGLALGKMKLERFLVQDFLLPVEGFKEDVFHSFKERIKFGWAESFGIFRRVWLWILAAVALGAIIHNYVPQKAVDMVITSTGIWSVPLAVLIGVPMYGSCATIVPIALALFQKGIPLGTALAFMMAISALSLPEAVMLRRAMQLKLVLIFFAITSIGIVFTGYLFNALQIILLKP